MMRCNNKTKNLENILFFNCVLFIHMRRHGGVYVYTIHERHGNGAMAILSGIVIVPVPRCRGFFLSRVGTHFYLRS